LQFPNRSLEDTIHSRVDIYPKTHHAPHGRGGGYEMGKEKRKENLTKKEERGKMKGKLKFKGSKRKIGVK
jgi:hypothetical protein